MSANNRGTHNENEDGPAPKIAVEISPLKAKIRLGEGTGLPVEICSEGSETVFLATGFDGPDHALARLKISLFHEGSPLDGTAERSAANHGRYVPGKAPPLAQEFSKYRVALAPRHFYGGDFVFNPSSFPPA